MPTRVLLVDDDEIVLDYLSQLVAEAGYEVVTATSGEAALACLQCNFAQLVVLDINMPGMDGLALCRAIRCQTYSGYVYLMLHTSKYTDEDILDGVAAGADDHLVKGSSKAHVMERLRNAQRILALGRTLTPDLESKGPVAMPGI